MIQMAEVKSYRKQSKVKDQKQYDSKLVTLDLGPLTLDLRRHF
jgi:hypothetical protein